MSMSILSCRNVLVVTVLLFSASFARAQDEQEAVSNWMMNYYRQPTPDKFLERVRQMSKAGVFEKQGAIVPVLTFMSEVLRANPDKIEPWVKDLEDLPPIARRYLLVAVWGSDTEEGRKALTSTGPKDAGTLKAIARRGKPESFLKLEITSPSHLDALWGMFFATGKSEPVERIISALSIPTVVEDGTEETKAKILMASLIESAAQWSLTSNAATHERVYEICERAAGKADAPLQKKLKALLSRAAEERAATTQKGNKK